jgi:hypothetical protein
MCVQVLPIGATSSRRTGQEPRETLVLDWSTPHVTHLLTTYGYGAVLGLTALKAWACPSPGSPARLRVPALALCWPGPSDGYPPTPNRKNQKCYEVVSMEVAAES